MYTVGTSLTKLGEILGSKAKGRQAKITAAKLFLAGNPRAFSLERVEKISKFYYKDFLGRPSLMVAAAKAIVKIVEDFVELIKMLKTIYLHLSR